MNPFANMTPSMIDAHNARVAQRRADYAKGNPFVEPAQPVPAHETGKQGVEREADLHDQILKFCRDRGWLAFHGSMAHRAMRLLGEPDFTILAGNGMVFFIEAKGKNGKLTREQLGLRMMAEKLGHTIHLVRSMPEFLRIVGEAGMAEAVAAKRKREKP